jgi:hypothetical protein
MFVNNALHAFFPSSQDCDVVLTFPPDCPEVTVTWLKCRLQRIAGKIQTKPTSTFPFAFPQQYDQLAEISAAKSQKCLHKILYGR